jgi:hypothetical protein
MVGLNSVPHGVDHDPVKFGIVRVCLWHLDSKIDFETAWTRPPSPLRLHVCPDLHDTDPGEFRRSLAGSHGYADPAAVPLPVLAVFSARQRAENRVRDRLPFCTSRFTIGQAQWFQRADVSQSMMMLSPMLVSAPFKIFAVCLDRRLDLVIGSLAAKFSSRFSRADSRTRRHGSAKNSFSTEADT